MDAEDEGPPGSPAPATGPKRPIYAIFEGGGAKGIAHIGALDAIKENGLEIIGVAGTSAGALAAVLAAIGLEGGDIMDAEDRTRHILAPRTPVSLLGENEWRRLKWLRHWGIPPAIATLLGGVLWGVALSPCNAGTVRHILHHLGLFSTDHIKAFVNTVIRERLIEIKRVLRLRRDIPEWITFGELAAWPTTLPLKIVATDIDQGTLEVFDAYATPDVVVAEAVAASISIPIAFQPARIPSYRPESQFADGGMVANLPIWAFVEDKLAHERRFYSAPPVPTVGFTLSAPDKPPRTPRTPAWIRSCLGRLGGDHLGKVFSYLRKLLDATLHGSQGTTVQFLEDVTVIPMKTTLDTLDFDRTWEDYDAARRTGFDQANRQLRTILQAKPDRIRRELAEVRRLALLEINLMRRARGARAIRQLRVNLMEPTGQHSLRIVASVGMERDADDRLSLDRRGRGAALAFRRRRLLTLRLGKRHEDRDVEFMTKYERALLRKSVRTVTCVPIFKDPTEWNSTVGRNTPHGILALDSDHDIVADLAHPHIEYMLSDRSNVLYGAISSEEDLG